ncbi:MAG: tyrosine-type recombinase/integrase [Verrucomicrobia bacterium]|nr:tyrosine-type recombinase/integrase [Verrucomicrobiota bacterium]
MAFIIQRPKTLSWTAIWKGPDGRQVRRVTGETSKRAAQAKANAWEIADAKRAGDSHDTHRAGFALLDQAARDLEAGHLTLQRTEELLRRLHRLADPDFREVCVIPWFQSWIESQRPHVSGSTLKGYGEDLEIMRSAFGTKTSNKPLRELTPQEIEKALLKAKVDRRGATVNKAFVSFRRACTSAHDKGLITASPAKTVKPLPTADTTLKAPFTVPEVHSLLTHADGDEWRGLITLACHTGLRLSDLLSLSARDVHGTEIHIMPGKTKRHKTVVRIPLSPPCLAWIDGRKNYFFPVIRKQPTSTTSMQFRKLMLRAGVPREIAFIGDQTASRSFHSTRHTFTSWLTDAGVDADLRMKLTGHSNDKTHAVYTHHSDEALAAAVRMLPNL